MQRPMMAVFIGKVAGKTPMKGFLHGMCLLSASR